MSVWTYVTQEKNTLIPDFSLISRILAAVLGGYTLASMAAFSSLFFSLTAAETAIFGAISGFLMYALSVTWVFLARSAKQAWLGLGVMGCLWMPIFNTSY